VATAYESFVVFSEIEVAVRSMWRQMRSGKIEGIVFACGALAMLVATPARAEDLVSPSYRLRGVHVATTGPAWLTSTASSPSISAAGVSVGQSEAIGSGFSATDLEASWAGFWPLVVGAFPNQDRDGDGVPDAIEISPASGPGTDPFNPDTDDDWLCDGPPSGLPACALGGEDLNGNGYYDVGFETDPNDPDTDGDAWSDGAEVLAGTNPLDPGSHPGAPAVPALHGPGFWLLTGVMGLIGIMRLRRRSRT